MNSRLIITISGLLFFTFCSVKMCAQAAPAETSVLDSHTIALQNLIAKLVIESGENFKKIRGSELSRRPDGGIEYMALIAYIAPGDDERGAMLTTDDAIIEMNGRRYYAANYFDDLDAPFSLRDFAETAFMKMNLWTGDNKMVFSTMPVATNNHTLIKSTALLLNGKRVAVFIKNIRAATSTLVIGSDCNNAMPEFLLKPHSFHKI